MTTTTDRHTHRTVSERERCFTGPVSRDENPAAHGCVTIEYRCACGAIRECNHNGMHAEMGDWIEPPTTEREYPAPR